MEAQADLELLPKEADALLRVAYGSIRHALAHRLPLPLTLAQFAPRLVAPGACFVSLHHSGELRGCIGTLVADRALVEQVSHSACAAALRDWRFAPLAARELAGLAVDVHVLGAFRALDFAAPSALYAQLRPGVDGLVLEQGDRQAVFLPAMWKDFPDPEEFVRRLLHKGGMPSWNGLRARRFSAVELHAEAEPCLAAAPGGS